MERLRKILLWISAIPAVLAVGMAWVLWGGVSNPAGRKTLGEIAVPAGFERVEVPQGSFGAFIREFPLRPRGSHMRYFSGRLANGQYFGYAVLDLPMISDIEQCADAVMRMRGEYLWNTGQYELIHFHSVEGKDMRFSGGADREALENYLRRVYASANTASLRKYMSEKDFKDVAPGDVLVYEAPSAGVYGHAVLVADVAVNPKTGKTALMLAQSSTPALTMHVVRNTLHPFKSPWVVVDDSDDAISISGIRFKKTDLRGWSDCLNL